MHSPGPTLASTWVRRASRPAREEGQLAVPQHLQPTARLEFHTRAGVVGAGADAQIGATRLDVACVRVRAREMGLEVLGMGVGVWERGVRPRERS